jgi:monofunctional biosynthetic peptidoglycan transglycosylase
MKQASRQAGRIIALLAISLLALQAYFFVRVALMAWVDPHSTTFERSEAWRLLVDGRRLDWQQTWAGYDEISHHLKRAVIASEDAGFADHSGVEWDAIERAWERNQRSQERADRLNESLLRRRATEAARPATLREARVVGGSTITQQLAKNLFLSGERTAPRKAQEFVVTLILEAVLDKRRILEIYLNHVEWGEGRFGAQAAARHYFKIDAAELGAWQAARLAVMLPAPKRFEKRPGSAYVQGRAATVAARMAAVQPP